MLSHLQPGVLASSVPLEQDPALLPTVLATLTIGVIVVEPGGRFVICNAAAERILGLTRSQIESRDPSTPEWNTIHEDGTPWPGDEHPVSITLRTGEAVHNEIMGVQRGDDTRIWLRVSSAPLYDPITGAVRAAIATFSDVTQAAEERLGLRRRSQEFSEIIDGAQVATFHMDLRTSSIRFSDAWATMLGYEPDETPTRLSQRAGNVHPDDQSSLARALESLGEQDTFQYDQRSRRKSGEWLWLRVRGKVVERDAQGRPVRVAGTQTNIHADKLAGFDAIEREAQLKAFFDSPAVGVALIGPDGRFERVNSAMCDMLGYSATELTALTPNDLTLKEDLATLARLNSELASGARDGFSVEKHCRRKNGTSIHVLVSVSRVRREADGRSHQLVVMADISSRHAVPVAAEASGNRPLPDMLSLCMHCKKVKDEDARWQDMAKYLYEHSHSHVSHGICPDCLQRYYGDYADELGPR